MLVDCGEDKEAVEGLLFELLRVEVAATLKVRNFTHTELWLSRGTNFILVVYSV